MEPRAAIIVLSPSATNAARRIAGAIGGRIHGLAGRVMAADLTFEDTSEHIRTLFAQRTPIIGVCAAGILVRALGSMLGDKREESPVLAVSVDGAFVVPLLGGHRGANDLAHEIATRLGSAAAVTTAGDRLLGVSLDEPPKGWRLESSDDAKSAMAALLAGATAVCEGSPHWLDHRDVWRRESVTSTKGMKEIRLITTEEPTLTNSETLVYHPQKLVVGVGSARDCPPEELRTLILGALEEADLAPGCIAALAALDLKADEAAMIALAEDLDVPLRLFDAKRLEMETPRLANPSDVVFSEVGCHGVAEAAALAGVGETGALVVEKRKSANATVAIARSEDLVDPEKVGRPRGRLSIIGIGPGDPSWRTPEAGRLIAEADAVVGYTLYLDIIASSIGGKDRHDYPLGAEEDRVRAALELAGAGRNVALISSGDADIYAMGALVYELVDRPGDQGGVSDAARRVEIVMTPGISALQVAAARVGAPLGHDFCTISLSDLLTPWLTIGAHLAAAAVGDFVVAFYNPVSQRRRTQLERAREILLKRRKPETPVVLTTNLGRPGESVRVTTLGALSVDEVNMLTVVLVGSTATRAVPRGAMTSYVYTPRGYATKHAAEAQTADKA
ncbi:precorrin-3B C(17)-methyltransferase [Breoghania sp.]|uniref:precorrin-3B C(17)-methyltransferase n=1 Tax=Breoghania sp. TaxID=2065378 RepID=UPI00262B6725|nr:precorrin-3B C(17)-methyltransferase [Breoghania sp.]MDJ0930959.1 precorrin-3B C(17)-methyltransferase [Breoghania sp.]